MKMFALGFFFLVSCEAAQFKESLSPVSRVVELLQGLSKQVEKEGKVEEDLYESFVCWGKSVVAQKTASNTAAESRIDSLKGYIADLASGRIELTTERQDLEKEVEELTGELEVAKAQREKEQSDFEAAKNEMTNAVKALSSAIKVLKEATSSDKKSALVAFRAELNGGFAALQAESANLNKAVSLGERFLVKSDAVFLRRLLTGDVPKRDENMLRKKADFKMSYKARSTKIQDVLSKLHSTFDKNLKEAESKEAAAQASYDTLSKSKQGQLNAAQSALTKMDVENGARGLSKTQAEDEVDALEKQVANDKKFITQTESSLEDKETEWKERSKLRDGELAAISKAISILHSDDARDNFKKSFASQGALFLQGASSASTAAATIGRAASELKTAARLTGDRRLSALAALAMDGAVAGPSAKDQFKPVLEAIDKMLALLKSEEKKDLETKQTCEEDRKKDTRDALLAGREIDDNTDAIAKLEGEIKDHSQEIKKILDEKAQVKKELDEADKIRKEENKAFQVTDKEDQEAAETVKSAKDVLQKFYKESFKLLQTQQGRKPAVAAGEAPPPPPATWDGGYGGKKGESTGIISILEMVHADILKDKVKAKAEEDKAQKEFDAFKKGSEKQMQDLQEEADKQSGIKGEKETKRTDTIKERSTKKGEYDAVMKKMEDIAPNCEYYTVNYKLRVANRQIEIDGLNKAKAILSGGSFKLL